MKKLFLLIAVCLPFVACKTVSQKEFDAYRAVVARNQAKTMAMGKFAAEKLAEHRVGLMRISAFSAELYRFVQALNNNDKVLWFSLLGSNMQQNANLRALISALKRKGIKIDLKKEFELLQKEDMERKLKEKPQMPEKK